MSPNGYWVHDLDPVLLHIWGSLAIRWYGIAYLAGLACGWFLLRRWAGQRRLPLRPDEITDFVYACGIGMIVGGRLGYCLLYAFDELVRNPLFLIRIDQGGMASHGGIIGLGLGLIWWARRHRRDILALGDAAGLLGTLGIGFGRVANFINGELWGRTTDVGWAVLFPDSIHARCPYPVWSTEWYSWVREFAEPRHPSQLYAAGIEGFFIFLILLPLHLRHRRPGLTLGLFLALYGVGRFVGEFFREPDAGQPGAPGVAPILGFMSKGQFFTLPFLMIGIALAIWALRRPARPEAYVVPEAAQDPAPGR